MIRSAVRDGSWDASSTRFAVHHGTHVVEGPQSGIILRRILYKVRSLRLNSVWTHPIGGLQSGIKFCLDAPHQITAVYLRSRRRKGGGGNTLPPHIMVILIFFSNGGVGKTTLFETPMSLIFANKLCLTRHHPNVVFGGQSTVQLPRQSWTCMPAQVQTISPSTPAASISLKMVVPYR